MINEDGLKRMAEFYSLTGHKWSCGLRKGGAVCDCPYLEHQDIQNLVKEVRRLNRAIDHHKEEQELTEHELKILKIKYQELLAFHEGEFDV